ncbi:MAG: carboxypeptidase-like regulatory domain-containing protein [Bryobacteraceae bacterium]
MFRFRSKLTVSFFAFCLAGLAQEFRATVTGRVTDPSGTGVPNAKIAVQNIATNDNLTANTGAEGTYTIPFIVPGKYSVTAGARGFKTAARDIVELHVNDKSTVDFTMEIGQVNETVNVTADAPMLDEATASRGEVIENLRVTECRSTGAIRSRSRI